MTQLPAAAAPRAAAGLDVKPGMLAVARPIALAAIARVECRLVASRRRADYGSRR
jgi:hypothetical protein